MTNLKFHWNLPGANELTYQGLSNMTSTLDTKTDFSIIVVLQYYYHLLKLIV